MPGICPEQVQDDAISYCTLDGDAAFRCGLGPRVRSANTELVHSLQPNTRPATAVIVLLYHTPSLQMNPVPSCTRLAFVLPCGRVWLTVGTVRMSSVALC